MQTSYKEEDFTWCPVKDMDGITLAGRISAPTEMVLGDLHFVDGWSVSWTTSFLEPDVPNARELPLFETPAVLLTFPDYPSDDTKTYIIPIDDADRFLKMFHAEVSEAKRETKRHRRITEEQIQRAEKETRQKERELLSCSQEGCKKQRQMFDENGLGWCKRHAEARGIRAHGKIGG